MTRSTVAASHRDAGRSCQNMRAADHAAQADKAQRMEGKKRFQRYQRPRLMTEPQEREARRQGRIILNSWQQSGMNLRDIFKRISMMINAASMN